MSRLNKIMDVVDNIRCLDRRFVVTALRDTLHAVHVEYYEADVESDSDQPVLQQSRQWLIGPDDDETAIVDTCFACVMRSYDHVVQEHFMYLGKRVFTPHVSISDRLHRVHR